MSLSFVYFGSGCRISYLDLLYKNYVKRLRKTHRRATAFPPEHNAGLNHIRHPEHPNT